MAHDMALAGRVALVTGGGRGIGRAISERLAERGARVAVNYRRDEAAAREIVDRIERAGGVARAYAAAVQDPDADAEMVAAVTRDLGTIDILVCNAGVASRGNTVADTDPSEVERVVATHAFGAHHLCRLVVPEMRTRERGDIVMISSVAAATLDANGAPYNMAKAALEALAHTLAKEEVRHGIRVNIVAPGVVDTDMGVRLARALTGERNLADLRALDSQFPLGRACQPDDVAYVVAWLCSDEAGYVTGQRIQIDGGAGFSVG